MKRDTLGNFSASSITAAGQLIAQAAVGNGNAISGSSASPVATVIYGGASSSTGATWGVEGEQFSSDPGASGVVGVARHGGIGVKGRADATGGIGVLGTAPNSLGFYTESNVQQARTMGGWVKAMVFYSGLSNRIASCFNSALSGTAATTPPCGFLSDKPGAGDYILDFGFEVDDRFFSVTQAGSPCCVYSYNVCTANIGVGCNHSPTANQLELIFLDNFSLAFSDTKFYLIVY